jgi:hypothetical protein
VRVPAAPLCFVLSMHFLCAQHLCPLGEVLGMHTAGASFVGLSECVLAVVSIMPLQGLP